MKCKFLFVVFVVINLCSNLAQATQLSANATSESETDARAEALRRLAESIQVKVSGETLVTSQLKNNVATQELVDSVNTSTDLTLLGAEVFVMKTKQGYRAEAQIDTEHSFNLYLTKIKAEKQLLDSQITLYQQQKIDIAKFTLANDLMPKLSLHIKDYLIASMLAPKPKQTEQVKTPTWMADLSNKNQWLLSLNDYVKQLTDSVISDPKLAAFILVSGIELEGVYTCPMFQDNGSWLIEKNILSHEINQALPSVSQSKEQAQYFLIGHAVKTENQATFISYQLVDVNGAPIQKNAVNYVLTVDNWLTQPKKDDAVLTTIAYEFKDKEGKVIPENFTTEKQLYTLAEKNILKSQSLVVEDPCRPIQQLSPSALTNAYGVGSVISITVAGNLSTFVLRPDPKEHEFVLAKVTYQQTDLSKPGQVQNKTSVGKKFPVLEPNDALIAAVETAFKKLN
ncbi:hypothetical protein [Thalassotalea sp. ND16A]|uniref:hypothetical protein n=1 Tax=Thalassotalea sp. ND16A TaxID=1535422 RepID=UPI00051A39A1|nr:hypothetical protein [Thalassotalea sp. ND16A]KGJ97235.1 hypothetical protein ND16A_1015 [Thalassotalea sp. ND16A]